MKRKDFIHKIAVLAPLASTMKVNALHRVMDSLDSTGRMPLLFLGHGSPMNAIEENEFVEGFRRIGDSVPRPAAILCVSAHWETRGTRVTAMDHPPTIHDFGGFPRELYDVEYPAPGSPDLARESRDLVRKTDVVLDQSWGLDHGAWTVIRHLYPDADIPVVQLSLDYTKAPRYHYELAGELAALRQKGVLIVGSGNIVHNLREVAWDKLNEDNYGYEWALEAREKFRYLMEDRNHEGLIDYRQLGDAVRRAVPTPEHYLPLLYVLAMQGKGEELQFFNDKAVGGSLTMTSVKVG